MNKINKKMKNEKLLFLGFLYKIAAFILGVLLLVNVSILLVFLINIFGIEIYNVNDIFKTGKISFGLLLIFYLLKKVLSKYRV